MGNDGSTGTNTTLTGANAGTTFNVTAANTGTAGGVSFSGVGNLTGGTGNDSFVIQAAGSLTGSVAGGGQTLADTLDLSNKTGTVAFNLQTGAATGIGSFGGIEALTGNDGTIGTNTTLTGLNAGATFNVTGTNSGTVSGVSFSGVGNLTGGSGNDSFVIQNAGSLAGSIVGGSQALADTLDLSNKTGLVALNLEAGAATGLGGTFSGIETLVGNDGTTGTNTTLTGLNAGSTFNVTAANTGTASGVSFSGVGNLTGGSGNDSFVIQNAGSLTGSIAGGSQVLADALDLSNKTSLVAINLETGVATGLGGTFAGIEALVGNDGTTGTNTTLTGSNTGITFNVTAANTGTAGGVSFSGVGNLSGGSGNDSFVIQNAGSLTGSVVGGSQALADTLDLSNKTGLVALNLETGAATGLGGTFSSIEALVGNDGTTGTNTTVTGSNTGTTFNLTAANAGTAGGVSFSGVGNLTGGSGNDSFVIQNAGSLAGSIAGGNQTLADILDLSNKTGLVAINLQTGSATGLGTFSGIEALVGNDGTTSANTTLTGANAGATFNVTAANAGTAGGMSFSGVGNLTGGSGNDSFVIQNAGSLTGSIVGGSQALADTLDLSNKTGTVAINLETGAATGLGGTFSGIETLVGNDGTTGTTTTLTGANAGTTYNISTANAGTAGGVNFSGVGNLTAGTGDDSLVFATAGSLSGNVAGGGHTIRDSIDLSAKAGLVSIDLQAATATAIGGTWNGINDFVGNDGTTGTNTALTGSNTGTAYSISAVNAGTAGGVSFSGVGNLTGGSGADTFNGAGGRFTGSLDDGNGASTLTGTIQTGGTQTYHGPVTLGTDTTLIGSTVTFNGALAGGAHGLAVTGNAVFGDATTDTVAGLTALSVSGTSAINTSTVTSSGTQTYTGAVTLGADTTLTGSTVIFNDTVAGVAHSLAVTGNAVFGDGTTDTVTGLTTLSVSGASAINTSAITSSGAQTYTGAVTLGVDTTLTGSTVTFNDTVAGVAHSLAVTGNAVFGDGATDTVTGLTTLSVSGASAINTSAITSSGTQTYGDTVTLGTGTTLTGTTVTFNGASALAGNQALAVAADAAFNGTVGIGSLNVSGTSAINTTAITTTGAQTYAGLASLGSGTTLTGTTPTFTTGVDGNGFDLTLSFSGTTQISGASFADINNLTSNNGGVTRLTGAIVTTGTQTYLDDVVLAGSTTTSAAGNLVRFGGTVNALTAGAQALTVPGTGGVQFDGAVGGSAALASLTVTGAAAINGGSIATAGDQTYSGAVVLGASTTLSGNDISFAGTVNSDGTARDLAVNTSGTGVTTFGASVGGSSALASLSTNADGATNIASGRTIRTTGAQSFADVVTANALTLDAGGAITAANSANDFSGTLVVTAGGATQIVDANSLSLGAVTITGGTGSSASFVAENGSITTSAAFSATGPISLVAKDTTGGNFGRITIGTGGLSSTGQRIDLSAADDITIDATVASNGGQITLLAGQTGGMLANPGTEAADNFGAVTLNASLNAGTGNIRIITAGDASASASANDVSQSAAGSIHGNALTVVTLKGSASGGGANVNLDVAPSNVVSSLNLFACLAAGCVELPTESPAGAPALSTLIAQSGTTYANGLLEFSGTSGGSPVTISGIGTSNDFFAFVNGSFNLSAFPFSANNVTVEAVGGDIILDLAAPLTQINAGGVGTLTFLASNDIIMTSRPTNTIGTAADDFDHHLVMKAGRHLDLDNSIYMGARNLTLASDAVFTTINQHTGPAGAGLPTTSNGLGGNGIGNVTLRGNHTVRTGGDVTITGVDFNLLGGSTGTADTTLQSVRGQELIAAGTINLMNSGVITVRAGTSNPVPVDTATGAPASGSGARLQAGAVNIGSASTPTANPTLLIIEGGHNDVGVASSSTSNPDIEFNQANAVVRANGAMNVYLSKKSHADTSGLVTVPSTLTEDYSLVVRGGQVDAQNGGTLPLFVTALGALQASTLTLQTEGAILFQGGTTDLRTANTFAASSALLLVKDQKTINAGGSVVLIGGTVNVNATDAVTLQPLTSTSAGNAVSLAQLDPSKLTMTVDGILVLQGGKTTGPEGALASARIDAGDEIRITVNGLKSYTYTPSSGPDKTLGPGSFFMIGGPDSGFFDRNNIDLAGSLPYPQAFPVTVNLAGNFIREVDFGLASGVVQTGLATFDDSLLSYIIFAANEETRALRIRRGFGDGDDVGAPACR